MVLSAIHLDLGGYPQLYNTFSVNAAPLIRVLIDVEEFMFNLLTLHCLLCSSHTPVSGKQEDSYFLSNGTSSFLFSSSWGCLASWVSFLLHWYYAIQEEKPAY
jgi:hypothetical protein